MGFSGLLESGVICTGYEMFELSLSAAIRFLIAQNTLFTCEWFPLLNKSRALTRVVPIWKSCHVRIKTGDMFRESEVSCSGHVPWLPSAVTTSVQNQCFACENMR